MLNKTLFFVVMVIFTLIGQAQDSIYESNSKSFKIGFLEPSRTIGKKNFLLEGGMSFYHSQFDYNQEVYGFSFTSVPNLKLRYGIGKSLEVFVEQNNFSRSQSTGALSSGYNTNLIGLGVKVNLSKQKGLLPQSSLSLTQQYIASSFSTPGFRTKVNFSWNYDLGKRFNLAGNIIYSKNNGYGSDLGLGLKLTYKINSKLGLYMDWYMAESGYDFSVFNIGAYYQVSPRFLVNANIGTNYWLTSYPNETGFSYNASLGISFLLNNPNKKKRKRK